MNTTVGEREIRTQERVIAFFENTLDYTYLGNWEHSGEENSNIIPEDLTHWLRKQGYKNDISAKALDQLKRSAEIGGTRTLYEANREVYGLLRYGVNVQPSTGEHRTTVKLIDWEHPFNNDFGIAEEVTLKGKDGNKRPDVVLYINGIAIGVLELKRSTVSVSEGIRQNLTNQRQDFIERFFATVQLVMAGNETQGLHYSVIKTPEKHWLHWKETEAHPDAGDNLLLRELSIGVHPPNGRVRVSAPLHFDADAIRMAVVSRVAWIRRQQAAFEGQDRQSQREFVTGESHYFRGRRYRLDVVERDAPPKAWLLNNTKIGLSVRPGSNRDTREAVIQRWYRQSLRSEFPPLLEKWEPKLGVSVNEVRIRKMKTLWGSCNVEAKRIWLNLELAKKPESCLVYVLVHEMVHLLEREHNDRFHELMNGFLPQWRTYRDTLNRAPLAHENWRY